MVLGTRRKWQRPRRDRDETLVRLETVARPRRRDRDHNPAYYVAMAEVSALREHCLSPIQKHYAIKQLLRIITSLEIAAGLHYDTTDISDCYHCAACIISSDTNAVGYMTFPRTVIVASQA